MSVEAKPVPRSAPPAGAVRGPGGRVPVLDGVRGLAALLVLVAHFMPAGSPDPLTAALGRLALGGWVGVDLFFVLSGFLITGILLDARDDPHSFRNFYARRVLRIFPVYYGTLVGVFVVFPLVLRATGLRPALEARLGPYFAEYTYLQSRQWAFWLYLTNVPGVVNPADFWYFLGHFWSLAVEEHFYMVWPLVVLRLDRRRLVAVCLGCMGVSLALRLALVMTPQRFFCYVFTPLRLDGLAAGSLLAVLARDEGGLARLARRARWVGGASAVALMVGFAGAGTLMFNTTFVLSVGFTLLALAFGAFLVVVLTAPAGAPLARVMGGRFLGFFGTYSYALYVFNRLLMLPCKWLFPPERLARHLGGPLPGALAHLLIGVLVTAALAWLSWHLYEKHFLRLKRYFASHA